MAILQPSCTVMACWGVLGRARACSGVSVRRAPPRTAFCPPRTLRAPAFSPRTERETCWHGRRFPPPSPAVINGAQTGYSFSCTAPLKALWPPRAAARQRRARRSRFQARRASASLAVRALLPPLASADCLLQLATRPISSPGASSRPFAAPRLPAAARGCPHPVVSGECASLFPAVRGARPLMPHRPSPPRLCRCAALRAFCPARASAAAAPASAPRRGGPVPLPALHATLHLWQRAALRQRRAHGGAVGAPLLALAQPMPLRVLFFRSPPSRSPWAWASRRHRCCARKGAAAGRGQLHRARLDHTPSRYDSGAPPSP
jgi:hypothetical protein